MNKTLLNKARLNVVSLNKALINGAVERHGSSAGGGGAPSKYIRFADPAVEAVLMANGVSSDGVGITKEDAAAVTSIGKWFKENTEITSFDEFEKFAGVTTLATESFYICTNLTSIKLPKSIKTVKTLCFYLTPAIFDVDLPNLESISSGAFWMSGISSIVNLGKITVLPDGGNARGVFKGCKNLVSANLPSSLSTIGAYCFQDDTALASVTYDWTKAVAINANAFYNCTALEFDELNLPNLTSLGQNAFYGVKIKKLTIGVLATSANDSTQNYGDKKTLEEIVLLDTITSIPNYSFVSYTNAKFVMNQAGITSIGAGAFKNSGLDGEVNFPNLTGIVGGSAFSASKIASVKNLGNITEIGAYAFQNCDSLEFVDLPATLTKINNYAFSDNATPMTMVCRATTPPTLTTTFTSSKVSTIYVPDAALEVYKTATNWSTYADRIHPLSELEGSPYIAFADPEVERVLMENNVSSDGVGITMADAQAVTDMTNTFFQNTTITSFDELEQFTNLVSLGTRTDGPSSYGTFSGCTNLKSVVLPPSVKTLGAFAFNNCSSLEQVGDLSGVETIGPGIFYNCAKLAVVIYMPNLGNYLFNAHKSGVVGIGNLGQGKLGGGWNSGCFQYCTSLKFAILPSSVTNITGYDFSGCTALQTLIMRNESPCTLGSLPTNLVSIYVPDASVDAYKEASGWSSYSAKIKPMSSIESDSLYAEFEQYL